MSKTFAFSSKNSLVIIIFFFFTLYFHYVRSYNDTSSDAEKSILLQLKDYWSNPSCLRSWNSLTDHCAWPEISCSKGLVVGITVTYKCGVINQTIPPLICDLKNVTHIDLSYNSIPGPFPTSLCNCSELKVLYLSGNSFVGIIPENIDELLSPHLEHLDLRNNHISGGIPAAIGNFTVLQYLYLSNNVLTGTIPDDFGKLKWLNHLDLSGNWLSGRIPSQLAALPYLSLMDLRSNQLSGPIPSAIGRSSGLRYLALSSNEFSGEIPSEIGNLSRLEHLDLSVNKFSGKIPSEIGNLFSLRKLHLSSNDFYGEITSIIGNLSRLEVLDISVNKFSGKIPSGIRNLLGLGYLDLSDNKFSGKIPPEIGNLSRLGVLDLSVNRLSAKIPSEIGNLSALQNLHLSNNEFSGKIKSEIGNLSSLEHLDLSVNKFSGKLPYEIGNLSSLEHLDLSQNEFSGKIPPEIGKLSGLRYLDLSDNKFSGKIPPEILLPNLTFVNVSFNRLCGSIPKKLNYSFPASCFSAISDSCNPLSPAKILSIVAVEVLLVMAFTYYILRRCKFTWYRLDPTWKLIPFQKLDFTESTILSSLIESNLVGCGGSGNVYKVQVNSSGEYVAVKRILINEKMDDKLEKQFLSEIQILGTIRHSNILKLMCSFSSENSKLLVYEYMENGSLYEWLHGERSSSSSMETNVLEWPKRLHIAIGTAQGLFYMHHCSSSPIIHRDLKSSNILLDSEFNAKIADFGLARILHNDGVPRTMSVVAGTFGYMAPEYAHTTRVTEKVDVYSFGVLLLEMVTGRQAHKGDENSSLAEWAWHHIQEENQIVDALDKKIKEPNHLDEMIKVFKLGIYCTHRLPSNRPTMREVLEILHLCTHSQAPQANILDRVPVNPIPLNRTIVFSLRTFTEI